MIPGNIKISNNICDDLGKFLEHPSFTNFAVLVDENTYIKCLPVLDEAPIPSPSLIKIKSGEEFKTLDTCNQVWSEMTNYNLDRGSVLINLGGGVISDLGGFCAATFKRGIAFINIPTTLLAMVDATIGGKLGIDFHSYKNHIGLFKEPEQVFVYPPFLKTLDQEQIRSGYAEVIKHTLINDAEGFNKLVNFKITDIKDWNDIIRKSIEIKASVVETDPHEKGPRKLLNFGHSIGHAIESFFLESNQPVLHGEAVAAGMICESYASLQYGNLSEHESKQIIHYLKKIFPVLEINVKNIDMIIGFLKQDKKNLGNNLQFTLLNNIGNAAYDQNLTLEEAKACLLFYSNLS